MALQLSDVEKRLQSLIEDHLVRYLPNPAFQDRVAHRLTEVLRANLSTRDLENQTGLPHEFSLVVHPSTLNQWKMDTRLMDGLTKIFRLVANETGLHFEIPPTIRLTTDPLVAIDDVKVRAVEKDNIAETKDTQVDFVDVEEDISGKSAFLIVGGTKVFTIQSTVTNIGRRMDNHLVVDDPRASRYHAQIRYVRGRFIIFDLNSTGGSFVNGQRISQSALYPGDVISLAGLPIIFGQDNPLPNIPTDDTAPTFTSSDRSTAILKNLPTTDKN